MFAQQFKKIGLGGGFILGFCLNLALVLLAIIGKNPLGSFQFSYIFFLFVLTMAGTLKYFRDYKNTGTLRTLQGITFASTVGFVGIILYLLGVYTLFTLNTDVFTLYSNEVKLSIERMVEMAGEEVTKEALKELKTLKVTSIVWSEAKKLILINLVFSLLIGVAFRKTSS